jgi:hypothetical protein
VLFSSLSMTVITEIVVATGIVPLVDWVRLNTGNLIGRVTFSAPFPINGLATYLYRFTL